ncbi:hypothetical protein L3X37_04450 [Sabulilitoribacter arenilitoris]|uniref:Uncharacterized protein n=1 Tax=Wocania arenilitoris TaxID=2044858 RepID=A0AAE3EPE4_9FLAO|nr:hypothetical protein [Wocania arenilitoris]MCF7567615.1 hypothetical protein [Wocania arenilitoris]
MPLIPSTAQYIADKLNCSLPTRKIIDIIYNQAEVKLKPQPIPPPKLDNPSLFKQHTNSIKQQLTQMKLDRSSNNIISGHK